MKILHLLLHDELKFNKRIVSLKYNKAICNEKVCFEYVTPFPRVYEALKQDGVTLNVQNVHCLINMYAEKYDYILLHSLGSPLEIFKVKNKFLGKIIWRTWGGDAGYTVYGNFAKRIIKRIINYGLIKKVKNFRAIGIASFVDAVDLKEKFGITKNLYRLPYPPETDIMSLLKGCRLKKDGSETINIMVEHSAWDTSHCYILKQLEKYKNEKIRVFLSLSYGPQENIERVRDYVKNECADWKEKIEFVVDFLPYEQFLEFIAQMDIAIFNMNNSNAMGNISLLLYFRKKLFLNSRGVICRAFDQYKIPHGIVDEIWEKKYVDFSSPLHYPSVIDSSILPHSYDDSVKEWNDFLEALEE